MFGRLGSEFRAEFARSLEMDDPRSEHRDQVIE